MRRKSKRDFLYKGGNVYEDVFSPPTKEERKYSRLFTAGIIFYRADYTAQIEETISAFADTVTFALQKAAIAQDEEELLRETDRLLQECYLIFVVSGVSGKYPMAVKPLLEALHVKFTPEGQPKGIFPLPGNTCTGYMPESRDKAICIFSDDPEEIGSMLEGAEERICKKFFRTQVKKAEPVLCLEKQEASLKLLFGEPLPEEDEGVSTRKGKRRKRKM